MSLQDSYETAARRRRIWSGQYSASASDCARLVVGSNAEFSAYASTSPGENLVFYVYSGEPAAIADAAAEEYNPAFVAEILAADAEPADEGFDNVVDLLEWLNRD